MPVVPEFAASQPTTLINVAVASFKIWQPVEVRLSPGKRGESMGINYKQPRIARFRIHLEVHMQNLLLLSVLLLSAAWAAAQDYPSQKGRDQTNSGRTTSTSTQTTTVQGCLSSSNGNYILTGNKGNTYQLTGDTSKLSAHVGHEVQIKGTPTASSSAGGTAGAPASSTMGQPGGSSQKLDVSSVKHVSKGCPSSSPR